MSAICGIYMLNGNAVSETIASMMMEKLRIYTYDKMDVLKNDEIFFGCGIQFVTPESQNEILPFHDKSKSLCITADAIIDNREELFSVFGVGAELWDIVTDSELILMAYEKWRHECPKYLIGDFAFSIWDENKNELFCARDHVGKRTFYYYYSNDLFAFCTLMKPLFTASNSKIELNERWIADFLAISGIIHETECNETVYKDIYQLPPAFTMTINSEGINKKLYWNPLKDVQPLRLKTDKEYEDAFKEVFFEAVSCRLRSIDEVGIMLSGGLDSGSIACIASKKLSEKNKKLIAFCSIPLAGYKGENSKHIIADESNEVNTICNYSGNINSYFFRSEGKHSLTDVESFTNIFEQPYKIFQNIFWLGDILKSAESKKCKVILTGQSGNDTISYGEFLVHTLTLFRDGKILSLIREIVALSKLLNISIFNISKVVLRTIFPYKFRKIVTIMRNRNNERFSSVAVNPELIRKWNVEKRFNDLDLNQLTQRFLDYYQHNKWKVDPVQFSHVGAIETKLSLANRTAIRDPSRDKRVIEFCLSLPYDQYVRNGQERFLIRRAMKDILPDEIRLNITTRGRQSADWIERLEPHWGDIFSELEQISRDEESMAFFDRDIFRKELQTMQNNFNKNNIDNIWSFMCIFIFTRFLKSLK